MTDSISIRVVMAVARAKGVDHVDLPPLHETVDPDALDVICGDGGPEESRRSDAAVRFTYAGRDVRIGNGHVTVGERGDSREGAEGE